MSYLSNISLSLLTFEFLISFLFCYDQSFVFWWRMWDSNPPDVRGANSVTTTSSPIPQKYGRPYTPRITQCALISCYAERQRNRIFTNYGLIPTQEKPA